MLFTLYKANGKVGGKIYWVSVSLYIRYYTHRRLLKQLEVLVSWPGEMEWTRFLSPCRYYCSISGKCKSRAAVEVSNIIYVVYDRNFVILCLCFTLVEDISSDLRLMMWDEWKGGNLESKILYMAFVMFCS